MGGWMFQNLVRGSDKPDSPLPPSLNQPVLLLASLNLADPLMPMVYVQQFLGFLQSFHFFFMTFSHFMLLGSKLRTNFQSTKKLGKQIFYVNRNVIQDRS